MYLKTIKIKNFRGIHNLSVNFHEKLNVIIGPNGALKSTLIDAIRLFYGWGDQYSDQLITREDFYREVIKVEGEEDTELAENHIEIRYVFSDLSETQLGAFCDYLVIDGNNVYAEVTIEYRLSVDGRISRTYYTGKREAEQKADYDTFQLFRSYYLSALRDSTHDLMDSRNNILGKVIKRRVEKNENEDSISNIFVGANNQLLDQGEVRITKENINNNLRTILKKSPQTIDLSITPNKIDYIVNAIKPFVPISSNKKIDGYRLWKNSLGYNNLIYIATVLSDIKDCHESEENTMFALFIEEPEAHLHPQLQINLYEFLRGADDERNSQIFITTHSPTLTSRIPLENIILLQDKQYSIANCFCNRASENIEYDTKNHKVVDETRTKYYRDMIVRYLDVTRSQLFFSSGVLFVEGISEALLLNTFSKIMGKPLGDYEIELIDTGGTAFGQFLMLFNSSDSAKRLPMKAAFITDADEFTDSKNSEYMLDNLIANDYVKLRELKKSIDLGSPCSRVCNMVSMSNNQQGILVSSGKKTLEFQIALANVHDTKSETQKTDFYKYLEENASEKISLVKMFLDTIEEDNLDEEHKYLLALLLWKCMPGKSLFAQDFAHYLENKSILGECYFSVPIYIQNAINFLID